MKAGLSQRADHLVAVDTLITRDGTEVTVTANRLNLTPSLVEGQDVAKAHRYFVGEQEAWAHNAGKPTKCECLTEALQMALDFVESEGGEPFENTTTGPRKWGAGVEYKGQKGTTIRIESDPNHGSHVNATCHKSKHTFTFPGGLPKWAKRGG